MGDKMIDANQMLKKAMDEKYAVPQFNINNLEWAKFILEECQKNNSPVILGVSEGAIKYMGGYDVVNFLVRTLVLNLNITIPVCLHLDHGSSFESCKKAIDAGFTSVMIDASKESLEDNIKITNQVIEYAKKNDVSVEAEIGHIGGEEDGVVADVAYAKVEDAVKFYEETKVDFFAPALGSVHGLYKGEPKLDFERMNEIRNLLKIPLVLHGGTGIPDDLIRKSINNGICKININTELQIEWSTAVKEFLKTNQEVIDPRKVIKSGEESMKKAIQKKIDLLGSNGKG